MPAQTDGRCAFCDGLQPTYPSWLHSDWIHDEEGFRDYDRPFPFTAAETALRDVRLPDPA